MQRIQNHLNYKKWNITKFITPHANPTTKAHALVSIRLNIVAFPNVRIQRKFVRDSVVAPFLLRSVFIVTLPVLFTPASPFTRVARRVASTVWTVSSFHCSCPAIARRLWRKWRFSTPFSSSDRNVTPSQLSWKCSLRVEDGFMRNVAHVPFFSWRTSMSASIE